MLVKNNNMNIKTAILPLFLFLSVFLFSFRNTEHISKKGFNFLSSIISPRMKTDTGGQVVSLNLVQNCINKYDSLMQAHGFTNNQGQPVDLHITTAMITNSETFNGKKLQDWLNATAADYKTAGKKLMIKI